MYFLEIRIACSHSSSETDEIASISAAVAEDGQIFAVQRDDFDATHAFVYVGSPLVGVHLVRHRR